MKPTLLTAVALLLAACDSGARAPRSSSVCELVQQPQRLVSVEALISDGSDGRTLLGDDTCPAIRIELQLTNAALRAGVRDQLAEALQRARSASPPQRVTAQLTGMFSAASAASGPYFSAEQLANLRLR